MKLYNTEAYGDPEKWPIVTQIVANCLWKEAEELYGEDLFITDMGFTNGRDVEWENILIYCKKEAGPQVRASLTFLHNSGVIIIQEAGIWITLTRGFIDAQQEARKKVLVRTYKLVRLFKAAHFGYRIMLGTLGIAVSLEVQQELQKKVGLRLLQLQRLGKIASKFRRENAIDGPIWNDMMFKLLVEMDLAQ